MEHQGPLSQFVSHSRRRSNPTGPRFLQARTVNYLRLFATGSLAGKYLLSLAKNLVGGLQRKLDDIESGLQSVIRHYEVARKLIAARFDRFDLLVAAAFDVATNVRLVATSVEMARIAGVFPKHILKDQRDLGAFLEGRHALNRVTGSNVQALAGG